MHQSAEKSQPAAADRSNERRSAARAVASFASKVAKEHGARPFPAAAQTLIRITSEPGFRIDDVVKVIESDPALTSQTLSQVNSAVYARRARCASVQQAVTLLGADALRSIATTAGVFSMFDDLAAAPAAEVVEHGTLVGAIARRLAPFVGLPPDEMYTCGLLHDVGKLMLLNGDDLDYPDLLAANNGFDALHRREREEYGFDHAVLAGHVLKAWRIPAPVPRVVGWHHQPERAFKVGGSFARRVALLRLADRTSYVMAERGSGAGVLSAALADDASLRYLGLSKYALEKLGEWLRHEGFGAAAPAGVEPTGEGESAAPEAPPARSERALRASPALEDASALDGEAAPEPRGADGNEAVGGARPASAEAEGVAGSAPAGGAEASVRPEATSPEEPSAAGEPGAQSAGPRGAAPAEASDAPGAAPAEASDAPGAAAGEAGDGLRAAAPGGASAPSEARLRPPPLPPSQHMAAAALAEPLLDAGEPDLEAWFLSEPTAEDGAGDGGGEATSGTHAVADANASPGPRPEPAAKDEPGATVAAASCAQCGAKPAGRPCPHCKAAVCQAHAPKGKKYCGGCEGAYARHRTLHPFEPLAVCLSASVFLLIGLAIGFWARVQHGPRWERVLGVALPIVLAELALAFALFGARRSQRAQFFTTALPPAKK